MSTKSSSSKKQIVLKNEMEKYKVIERLGEGSFGRVYKARDLSDSSFVALKIISKGGRSSKDLVGLRRECEIQRHLHHPNIIQMLHSFETSTEIVVVTEFAQRELNSILGKEGFLSEKCARSIIWDLVSALNYLHSHRVLHRDLKPQNVLIDSKNKAKLCDFGFARSMSTGTHVLTSIKGTPLYMAPELIKEQPYDYKADLWSLGCIMYEVLVGAPPFCTASILQLFRLIQEEQVKWPTFVSDYCISFLKGLLQKDPSKRISWEEILNHPFVKGHILICDDAANKPFTRAPSAATLQAKEQQRRDRLSTKGHSSAVEAIYPKISKSPQSIETTKQDTKNNNISAQLSDLSLEGKTKSDKFNFIEEKHPIETEEWIVFLQKTMEEVISGELTSLTQPNLANIIVSPLRNSNTSPKVLSYVAKLLSLPFVVQGIKTETIEQIRKVYLEVKLIPNLVYASKLLLRVKSEESSSESIPPNESYKHNLIPEDFEALEYIFMLITHLVYIDHTLLIQLCDSTVILNVYSIFGFLLVIRKNNLQIVTNMLAILTHILRIFPENYELICHVLKEAQRSDKFNFVELLRHSDALMRERACFFLMHLGKTLPVGKIEIVWNENVRKTIEDLKNDSMESVQNAAEKTVEELKSRDFYTSDFM